MQLVLNLRLQAHLILALPRSARIQLLHGIPIRLVLVGYKPAMGRGIAVHALLLEDTLSTLSVMSQEG